MQSGTLTVGSVLIPFVGIVITCNLFGGACQKFFWESVLYGTGSQLPSHPMMMEYAQRLLSAFGVLVPLAVVAVLPAGVFHPAGRTVTVAALCLVAAAWAFYGAAVSAPVFFVAGALTTSNPAQGLSTFLTVGTAIGITVVGLTIFFWLRIALSILKLNVKSVLGIGLVVAIAEALLAGFFLSTASGA
jgi:hypothetical protein